MLRLLLAGLIMAGCMSQARAAGDSARGEYIVTSIAMCGDCHTPRDATGALLRTQWLAGAPIDFRPQHPMPFAVFAPRLAGLPAGYTREALITFLQTGRRADGSMARPPMPPYRMNAQDAADVATYLERLR